MADFRSSVKAARYSGDSSNVAGVWRRDKTHLARVDLLTAERIVVGTHLER